MTRNADTWRDIETGTADGDRVAVECGGRWCAIGYDQDGDGAGLACESREELDDLIATLQSVRLRMLPAADIAKREAIENCGQWPESDPRMVARREWEAKHAMGSPLVCYTDENGKTHSGRAAVLFGAGSPQDLVARQIVHNGSTLLKVRL